MRERWKTGQTLDTHSVSTVFYFAYLYVGVSMSSMSSHMTEPKAVSFSLSATHSSLVSVPEITVQSPSPVSPSPEPFRQNLLCSISKRVHQPRQTKMSQKSRFNDSSKCLGEKFELYIHSKTNLPQILVTICPLETP